MRESRALTGIDIVDADVTETLERLVQSLNAEAELNARGARAMEDRLLRILSNRLRMERDFAAHPDIATQKIAGPLFLTGGPRTGSTKLHKLLGATGDFIFLPFWQGHCLSLRSGHRGEDPGPRIAEATAYIQWIETYAPKAQRAHAYGAFEPEEEALILEHFLCSTFPNVFAHVPSFMAWWATQDFSDQARFLKRGLQYLQWQFYDGDPRRWALKCPIYPGLEPVLADIFPGAVFVTTNRDPSDTLPSTVNLVQGYREAYSDVDRTALLGQVFFEGLAAAGHNHMRARDTRPDLDFLDVCYGELVKDSERVIEAIYAHAHIPFSENARRAINKWEAAHGHSGQRPPVCTLADCALTRDMVKAKFADYIARFGQYF